MKAIRTTAGIRATAPRVFQRQAFARRQLSTTPPSQTSRSWKSSAVRWGLAGGGIWYYNTHDVWADSGCKQSSLSIWGRTGLTERVVSNANILETKDVPADAELPTVDSLFASRKDRLAAIPSVTPLEAAPLVESQSYTSNAASATPLSPTSPDSSSQVSPNDSIPDSRPGAVTSSVTPGDLEEEAEGEGAFNPETGEINWDCPCLGGMAYGPCGTQFRDAFSCFIYSEKEPKGIECIDKFKAMQDCFREHPDVYGSELTGEGEDELEGEMDAAPARQEQSTPVAAPYSGAKTPVDEAPGANLTSTPSAHPSGLGGSSGISSQATSKDDHVQKS